MRTGTAVSKDVSYYPTATLSLIATKIQIQGIRYKVSDTKITTVLILLKLINLAEAITFRKDNANKS